MDLRDFIASEYHLRTGLRHLEQALQALASLVSPFSLSHHRFVQLEEGGK